MKITDLRTSRVHEGEHVATIPGGSVPEEWQAETLLKGDMHPCSHRRVVLRNPATGAVQVFSINPKYCKVQA